MKLTKKLLSEIHIHNSHNLARAAGNPMFVDYVPADNGRLTARYAYWNFIHFVDEAGYKYRHLKITVPSREDKEPALQKIILYAKEKYGIVISERDVFGGYHPEGTLAKIERKLKEALK